MDRLFVILERFAPDAVEIIENRYDILRQVSYNEPIGRRQLCKELNRSERTIRTEIDILKARGAVNITPAGIYISNSGKVMLQEVSELIPALLSIQPMAENLKKIFHMQEVIVVPGDCYLDPYAKKDIGRAAARYLNRKLRAGSILAVTGGSTLVEVAAAMQDSPSIRDVTVVPARGGLGEEMEQQAGTIAAGIAKAIGGQYRLLHIPDNLSVDTVEALKKDAHIQQVVKLIKKANLLVHGIGPAINMAVRRGLSPPEIAVLEEKTAVGEALRYYFDETGKIVYEVCGIGLELDDLNNIETVVAVAGGRNKARAIKAVLNHGQHDVLITDEGAAREILATMN